MIKQKVQFSHNPKAHIYNNKSNHPIIVFSNMHIQILLKMCAYCYGILLQ